MRKLSTLTIESKFTIDILCDISEEHIFAYHNDKRIGCFSFATVDYDEPTPDEFWLVHMSVDEAYQHNGIGTAMLKAAVDNFQEFLISTASQGDNPLTIEGATLVNSCLRKNILPKSYVTRESAPS